MTCVLDTPWEACRESCCLHTEMVLRLSACVAGLRQFLCACSKDLCCVGLSLSLAVHRRHLNPCCGSLLLISGRWLASDTQLMLPLMARARSTGLPMRIGRVFANTSKMQASIRTQNWRQGGSESSCCCQSVCCQAPLPVCHPSPVEGHRSASLFVHRHNSRAL